MCLACFDFEIQPDQGKAGYFSKRMLRASQSCFLEVKTMSAGYFNEFQIKSCVNRVRTRLETCGVLFQGLESP